MSYNVLVVVALSSALFLASCSSKDDSGAGNDSAVQNSGGNTGSNAATGMATSTFLDLDNDGVNDTYGIDLDGDGVIDGYNDSGNTNCEVEEGSIFCAPVLAVLQNPGNLACPHNPSYLNDFNFDTPLTELPRWRPSSDGTVTINYFLDASRNPVQEHLHYAFLQVFAVNGYRAWTHFPDGSPTWVNDMFKFAEVDSANEADMVWSFSDFSTKSIDEGSLIGLASPSTSDGFLSLVKIDIIEDWRNVAVSNFGGNEAFTGTSAAHEVGHALGLLGHAATFIVDDVDTIMLPAISHEFGHPRLAQLQDLNSLANLYCSFYE